MAFSYNVNYGLACEGPTYTCMVALPLGWGGHNIRSRCFVSHIGGAHVL